MTTREIKRISEFGMRTDENDRTVQKEALSQPNEPEFRHNPASESDMKVYQEIANNYTKQPNEPVGYMTIDSVASGIINGKRQALPMGSVYYLSPPNTSELEAKVKRLEAKLDKADDYIKRMDRVIDNKGITQSCINPLVDLTNSVDYMVAKIAELEAEVLKLKDIPMKYKRMGFNARLQQENSNLTAKLEKMRDAICIYSREMLGDINFESDEQAINYMLSFTEENPHGEALEECK